MEQLVPRWRGKAQEGKLDGATSARMVRKSSRG
ncbi:hypothetical protein J2S17_002376 [Cytobacillus purgationiresistens]|uniref:Uncharacterized protein n=1 Tax=Cytobacillus purgationiresistens TaxID=863449 RepID=A0ABU0AIG4_9BACI|nr:hypothetical protein [Cytobacillus purgationiresistens]